MRPLPASLSVPVVPDREREFKHVLVLTFILGLTLGLGAYALLDSLSSMTLHPASRPAGSWPWLVFGFAAQAIFMGRMLLQWIATEKARSSVVPAAFWWLSLAGGLMLLTYFLHRQDPVGIAGQAFGVLVYTRNLIFIQRRRQSAQ